MALVPMRVTDGFRDFVLDQLGEHKLVTPRSMFGGIGLYCGELFFGIMAADVLYLKVDESSRARYEAAGMNPFKPYEDRPATFQYYEVPGSVLEDADELAVWAAEAIRVAEAKPRALRRRRRRPTRHGGSGKSTCGAPRSGQERPPSARCAAAIRSRSMSPSAQYSRKRR